MRSARTSGPPGYAARPLRAGEPSCSHAGRPRATRWLLLGLTALLLGLGFATGCGEEEAPAPPPPLAHLVSPQQVAEHQSAGSKVIVLDVRREADYGAGHAPGAVSLPLGRVLPDATGSFAHENRRRIEAALVDAGLGAGREAVVIAEGGAKGFQNAAVACYVLDLTGVERCHILEGGYPAWTRVQGSGSKTPGTPPGPSRRPAAFPERPPALVDLEGMRSATVSAEAALLDIRPRPVSETIPGAYHAALLGCLEEDGRIDRAALHRTLSHSPVLAEATTIVVGHGFRDGAAAWFLLERGLGLANVRLFPGGMRRYRTYPRLPLGPGEQVAPGPAERVSGGPGD